MKRFARLLGILGGLAALAWAMRDRFVSVAISREPEPPAFKVPEPPPSLETSSGELTSINGIGPVYATRLESAGISTVDDLAASRPDQVASAAQVPLSRAAGWIDFARASLS